MTKKTLTAMYFARCEDETFWSALSHNLVRDRAWNGFLQEKGEVETLISALLQLGVSAASN
jgi:hypothetical protein